MLPNRNRKLKDGTASPTFPLSGDKTPQATQVLRITFQYLPHRRHHRRADHILNWPDIPMVARPYKVHKREQAADRNTARDETTSPLCVVETHCGLVHEIQSPEFMSRMIRDQVTQTWAGESDEQTQQWANAYFASPLVPNGRNARIGIPVDANLKGHVTPRHYNMWC